MFSPQGLFRNIQCPEPQSCARPNCVFSHKDASDLPPPASLEIPVQVDEPKAAQQVKTVPAKRTVNASPSNIHTSSASMNEPPRKVQKLDLSQKRIPQQQSSTPTGVPVLKVLPATSYVAIPVRQTMLKTLYEHFVTLYDKLLPSHPNLASEHALRQEEDVYKNSNKFSYRNAVIQCVSTIKRRPPPTSVAHPSVGTEGDLAARAEAQNSIDALHVTATLLEPYIPSLDILRIWGYVVDIPIGPSGTVPHLLGTSVACERCGDLFVVRSLDEHDPAKEECLYHWGRPYSRVVNGERVRAYNCCSKDMSDKGCVRGPHVFYENKPETLHLRHSFSQLDHSSSTSPSSQLLDVVALDCEMIYTTGGMRVARVSVVDGSANPVFDEIVRMDEGVDVLDFNTRFSGITRELYDERAVLTLASIRESLNALIGRDTILIGHALENDLKTLRIVHLRCIDTVLLYPHPRGAPYRRSLRDLTREHLNMAIQEGGGSSGHSSLEDAIATLNLVRLHLINHGKSSKGAASSSSVSSTQPASSLKPRNGRSKVTPVSYFMKPRHN